MVFNIELSVNILQNSTLLEKIIIDLANKYECISTYLFNEMENTYYKRNHTIIVVIFENKDILLLENFIKDINKIKDVYIECLYEEDIKCKIIYASAYYLTTMDKDKISMYQKRKRSYSEDETILVNGIKNKK
jgi:hypothetical protein